MKKVLMISLNDIGSTVSLGVTKKIIGQYKAFQKLGYETYNLCLDEGKGVICYENEKTVLFSKQVKTYVAYIKLFGMAKKICKEKNIDVCYIRYPLADWVFCRTIKQLHNCCSIIVEIPTFPYDIETKNQTNIVTKFNYWQDKRNRNKIRKYIDLVVNYGECDQIYGIKALKICNGIDINSIRYIEIKNKNDNEINLITVALMRKVHGYDRIITGLKNYYSKGTPEIIVKYHVVGDGDVLSDLKEMVKNEQLTEYVKFYGIQSGEALDQIFCNCDIGLTVLAGHREGLSKMSDLKSREYCARGIPFVYASEDDAFPEEEKFHMRVSQNDDPINIEQIVEFALFVRQHNEIHKYMRNYAEKNLTWENQMKKVMDKIKNL